MAIIKCTECGKQISDKAEVCPNCGNPMSPKGGANNGTYCSSCGINVTPVVTSVGGGSCSFGKRETWKCPKCKRVLHKSGCFVATVTYGDEDIIEVRFLRAFRDEVLTQSALGQASVWVYYKCGNYAARIVELLPFLKRSCRCSLDGIVRQIERKTHLKRTRFRNPRP